MTFMVPVGPQLAQAPGRWKHQAGLTLGTLVVGWWGIPWGPVKTVQAVYRNLRPDPQTVGDYLLTFGSQRAAPAPKAGGQRWR